MPEHHIGHFEILQEIGSGGMGVVYLARDERLNRQVAIKLLPVSLSHDLSIKQRFLTEARAASALDHPNICTIYETGESEEGQTFIAMAYYEGKTLQEILTAQNKIPSSLLLKKGNFGSGNESCFINERSSGIQPLEKVIDIAIQTGQGLAEAHRHHIIHRDIKPGNIIVTSTSLVKIIDFGMALLVHAERVTRTGTTLGTVQYMSPEQAIGGQVDGRSDIWSLGIVLYEMLAGQPPFNGESEASVLYAIVNEEETPIEQLRTDLPQPLAALVHKAIAKNPQQRYQTMVELVEDLGAIKTGRKIDVKRPSSPKRRAKGRRALWSVAAALVLILLANFADRIFFHREIIDAVAVLPFRNLSGDTEQEWLADALTEQITTGLQSIPTLLVRPNMSSRQYKNTDKKLANIANELRVQAVIEGTILRRANYVRLNIHLIHALKNQQLWSASFEQDIEDVFALRNEIVRALIGEINSKLLPEAKARMTQTEHVKQVAFEAAQRGRWTIASSQGAEKKIDQGIELLRKAIAFDPDYAAAHAQLGWGYLTKAIAFADSRRLLPLMRTEAETALRLDENLAEAHCLMARVHGFDYDWPRMETELQQALSLNPNDVTAYFQYGQFLLCHGRFNEGISFVKRSIDLDPLADPDSPELAVAYSLAGRIDESINLLDKVLKKYPENIDLHAFQAANYAEKRKIPEMQKEIDLVMAANPSPYSSSFFNVAGAHAIAGHRTQALAMLTEIIRATDENYVDPLYIASYAGLVEQVDEAIKWYERAFIEKSSWLMYTRVFTRVGCEKLRADPRFQSFLSRIHL